MTGLRTLIVKKWNSPVVLKVCITCDMPAEYIRKFVTATPSNIVFADMEIDTECDHKMIFNAKKIENITTHTCERICKTICRKRKRDAFANI